MDASLVPDFAVAAFGAVDLAAGEVHVWALPLTGDLEGMLPRLSRDEVQRADRFLFHEHRRRYVISHALLRQLLGAYLHREPQALQFAYGERGKPHLDAPHPLHFNLSHSSQLAMVAVGHHALGVDLERVRHLESLVDIARRHFAANELTALLALPDTGRLAAFYRCWTRKEAYIKATGQGLSMALDSFEVAVVGPAALQAIAGGDAARWTMADVSPGPDYVAAVAIEQPAVRVRCFRAG